MHDQPHKNTRVSLRKLIALIAPFALMISSQLLGQETSKQADDESDRILEEVIVSAQKREQRLLDVPISIGVLTAQTFEDLGIDDFQDWGARVPGIGFTSLDPGAINVNIRGISSVALSTIFVSRTTAVYFDDTAMMGFPPIKVFDLERIEVMRGPQGTLYGSQALGGLIRFVTNKPDASGFAAKLQFTGSSTAHGGENFQGDVMLNVPLVEDKVALRVVAWDRNEDGFIDNIAPFAGATGTEDSNDQNILGGRFSIRALLSDKLEATISVMYQDMELGDTNRVGFLDPSVPQPDWINGVRLPETVDETLSQFGLNINYELGFADLISATTFFDRDREQFNDINQFLFILQGFFDPTITFLDGDITTKEETFTQELRLVSSGDGPWQWTAGGFYRDSETFFRQTIITNGETVNGLFSDDQLTQKIKHKALFGELYYNFSDDLKLTLGLRYFDDEVEDTSKTDGFGGSSELSGVTESDDFLYKVALNYALSDDVTAYATVGTGYRQGGIEFVTPLAQIFLGKETAEWDPDFTTNYEIGFKGSFLDHRLRLAGSVYYIDWKDMQVEEGIIVGEAVLDAIITNVGEAHSTGFDLEATLQPVDNFELFGTITVQEAETDIDVVSGSGAILPAGQKMPNTVDFAYTIGAAYSFDVGDNLRARISGDYLYQDDRFGNIENTIVAESYGIGNLRASLSGESWDVVLFVDNVSDKAADVSVLFASNWIFRNTPRTIGVTVRKSY